MENRSITPVDALDVESSAEERDFMTPIVLGALGIVELGWVVLLGWAALWMAGY